MAVARAPLMCLPLHIQLHNLFLLFDALYQPPPFTACFRSGRLGFLYEWVCLFVF